MIWCPCMLYLCREIVNHKSITSLLTRLFNELCMRTISSNFIFSSLLGYAGSISALKKVNDKHKSIIIMNMIILWILQTFSRYYIFPLDLRSLPPSRSEVQMRSYYVRTAFSYCIFFFIFPLTPDYLLLLRNYN